MQFVRDARTLSTTFFPADIIFEVLLPLAGQRESSLKRWSPSPAVPSHGSGIRAAPREAIGVDGANPGRNAGNRDRMYG